MGVEAGDPRLPAYVNGSIENPRRWITVSESVGTNAFDFADFCDKVCKDIEDFPAPGNVDEVRVFMWDNLAAHLSPIVAETVEARPTANMFVIVRRPPYQPKFGPIEYVFSQLAAEMEKRVRPDWGTADLIREVKLAAFRLGRNGGFNNTFAHCGY
jgi:DDE superfamily endonuclease